MSEGKSWHRIEREVVVVGIIYVTEQEGANTNAKATETGMSSFFSNENGPINACYEESSLHTQKSCLKVRKGMK